MPFTIKHNKRIKLKGLWNTTTQDTLLAPHPPSPLGRSIVLNDSRKLNKINGKKDEEGGGEEEEEEEEEEEVEVGG